MILGATMVAVFLAMAVTLRQFDAAALTSSTGEELTTKVEQPDISAPSRSPTPPVSYKPARRVTQPAVSKPSPVIPDVPALEPQMAAGNTPIADPSTFGTEAAEPIYAN
jgi:hypothetical protein